MRLLLIVCLLGSISLFSQGHNFRIDVCDNNLSADKRKIARSIIVALEQGRPDIMANYYPDVLLPDLSHAENVIAEFYQKPIRKSFPMITLDTSQAMSNRYYRLYSESRTAKNAPSARIEIIFSDHELDFVIKDIIVHEGINEKVDEKSVLYLITCGKAPWGGISRETFFDYEINDETPSADFIKKKITIRLPKDREKLTKVINSSGIIIALSIFGNGITRENLKEVFQCKTIHDLQFVFPVSVFSGEDLNPLFQMTWLKHLSIIFGHSNRYYKNEIDRVYKLHHIPDKFDNFKGLKSLELLEFYSDIPPSIANIEGLMSLELRGKFTDIPASLSKLENLEQIKMTSLFMESFPDAVLNLTNLRDLSICLPRLKSIPNKIANLRKLQTFKMIKMDDIKRLPDSFGGLANLRRIDYSSMSTLPSSPEGGLSGLDTLTVKHVADCSRLLGYANAKYLELLKGNDEVFTPELASFQNLEKLAIKGFSNLWSLPEFSGFPKLKGVTIKESKITEFPLFISLSPKVKWVNLRENQIEQIPAEVIGMIGMEELILIKNKITHLPAVLCELPNCKKISLGGNKLESIDTELFNCERKQKMVINISKYDLTHMSKEELESKSTRGLRFMVY